MSAMKFALFLLGSWTEQESSAQSRIFGEMLEQVEYDDGRMEHSRVLRSMELFAREVMPRLRE